MRHGRKHSIGPPPDRPRGAQRDGAPLRLAWVCVVVLLAGCAQRSHSDQQARLPWDLSSGERYRDHLDPLTLRLLPTSWPVGRVDCPAEYEPMEGLLIAWITGGHARPVIAEVAARVTSTGAGNISCVVASASDQQDATAEMQSRGADMSRVSFLTYAVDGEWIRDYGPRFVYENDVRCVIDHTYNWSGRLADNAFNGWFAGLAGHRLYEHLLVHGGGNFLVDSAGSSFATKLVVQENPLLTESQVLSAFQHYLDVQTTLFDPLPAAVDSTQHIDMWMQVVSDDLVIISDWPSQSGSPQDQVCDAAALAMAARGYEVRRVPAVSQPGQYNVQVHYTYTNAVICNDLVLIPSYTATFPANYNDQALEVWQSSVPATSQVVQVDCDSFIWQGGALHCLTAHVPAYRGQTAPTVFVQAPQGGESIQAGAMLSIHWISDDDVLPTSADILLSTDGGTTWPHTVATGQSPSGSYYWPVADLPSSSARIRVVVHDGDGNSGSDVCDADFEILP